MVHSIVADMRNLPIGKIFLCVIALLTLSGCTNTYTAPSIGGLPTPSPTSQSQILGISEDAKLELSGQSSAMPATQDAQIATPLPTVQPEVVRQVVIRTTKGDITLELFPEDAPKTVENFLNKMRAKTYTNRIFHRVENWVIQGGDPMGNGTGGGEIETELSSRQFGIGSVGVARGGNIRISNSDQFFICTDDCSWLTGQYAIFGKVVKGLDVAKKIQIGDSILEIVSVAQKKSGRGK